MKKFTKVEDTLLYIFLEFIFQSSFLLSSSQILNNIIRLGAHPYAFNHFSYNSNGDLIIDIESYPLTQNRNFFGITKDWKEYFINEEGNKSYHSSSISNEGGRGEGESCFIKIESTIPSLAEKEYLIGISRTSAELYILDEIMTVYNYDTYDLFGNISTNIFSLIPNPLNTDNTFNYYMTYIKGPTSNFYPNNQYILYSEKIFFTSEDLELDLNINRETFKEILVVNQAMISCFFTKNNLYICFFTNIEKKLSIWVISPETGYGKSNYIYTYNQNIYRRFYKGIHLKDEIGFFAFFKDDGEKPYFSLYQIQSNKTAII